MLCKNCGYQSEENLEFCPQCGNPLENEAVQEVQEDPVAPVAKKGVNLLAWIITGVVAVAIVLVVAFNWAFIGNFLQKTFSSEEAYFKAVNSKHTDRFAEDVGDVLETYGVVGQQAAGAEMSVELGEAGRNMLEELSGMDFAWLSEISMDVNYSGDDSVGGMISSLKLNGKDVADVEVISDVENRKTYIGLPGLSDTYIYTESYENTENAPVAYDDILDKLPESDVVEKLIKRYMELIFENTGEVTSEDAVLEINGIAQKSTAYATVIDETVLKNIIKVVLTEAKSDEEIEKIIKDVASVEGLNADADEAYEDFCKGLDELLTELDEITMTSDLKYTAWIDNKGNIIGREFNYDGVVFSYKAAEKNDAFAVEMLLSAEDVDFIISGEGTVSKGKINGDFVAEYAGAKLLMIKVSDFDKKSLEDDLLNGTMEVSLNSGIASFIGAEEDYVADIIKNYKLKIIFEDYEDNGRIRAELLDGSGMLLAIDISGKEAEYKKPDIPSNAISMDSAEAEEWAADIDTSKIYDNLKIAGMPEDLVMLIEYAMESSSGVYDDYYDDTYGNDIFGEDIYVEDYFGDEYYAEDMM